MLKINNTLNVKYNIFTKHIICQYITYHPYKNAFITNAYQSKHNSQHIIIMQMTYANAQRPTQRLYACGTNITSSLGTIGIIAPTPSGLRYSPSLQPSQFKAYDVMDRSNLHSSRLTITTTTTFLDPGLRSP